MFSLSLSCCFFYYCSSWQPLRVFTINNNIFSISSPSLSLSAERRAEPKLFLCRRVDIARRMRAAPSNGRSINYHTHTHTHMWDWTPACVLVSFRKLACSRRAIGSCRLVRETRPCVCQPTLGCKPQRLWPVIIGYESHLPTFFLTTNQTWFTFTYRNIEAL